MKLLKCSNCGNLFLVLHDSLYSPSCCNRRMDIVNANTTDGTIEKHLPVVDVQNCKVTITVGSTDHPMTEQHFIEWIGIETSEGVHIKALLPDERPQATFILTEHEELIKAYAYCNLHGLWEK